MSKSDQRCGSCGDWYDGSQFENCPICGIEDMRARLEIRNDLKNAIYNLQIAKIRQIAYRNWIDVKEHWPLFCQTVRVRCDAVDGKWKEFEAALNGNGDDSYWVYASPDRHCHKVEWPEWITHWKPLDGQPLEFSSIGPK